MDGELFEQYRQLVYQESGIVLGDDKKYLLANRIQRRLRELQLSNPKDYFELILTDATRDELINLIDAISTNLTYFYREAEHFGILRRILSEMSSKRKSPIKLWCAAASSGEEPYTIGMEASECLHERQEWRILATDICVKVLKRAVEGVYSGQSVQKVPSPLLQKYFIEQKIAEGSQWKVRPELSSRILFKRFNLIKHPYQLQGNFDIIFCRNVMIYFDSPTRQAIVDDFFRQLRPGGYLFISLSESFLGLKHSFQKVSGSVFQKP